MSLRYVQTVAECADAAFPTAAAIAMDYAFTLLYAITLILAVVGWREWLKVMRAQEAVVPLIVPAPEVPAP